ncbi:MAG: hypothetical protein RBS88_11565 [Spongiibacteraceae bacterium]|jgi:hypothetical protein|nr:hypothetical protein [Spongiibacteraceae bacterium]
MSDLHRGPSQRSNLLDELESLKQLLNESGTVFLDDAPSIPVLRDVVTPGSAPLLDLEEIFDDEVVAGEPCEESAPADAGADVWRVGPDVAASGAAPADSGISDLGTASSSAPVEQTASAADSRWQRELLIQEVVDEFVPRIEAALRERLRHLDDETLRSWLRRD